MFKKRKENGIEKKTGINYEPVNGCKIKKDYFF